MSRGGDHDTVPEAPESLIIADPSAGAGASVAPGGVTRGLVVAIAVASAAWGSAAAVFYYAVGLSLAHYDAKAHLVVARRILDSLTPGWEQIGAVWLPLPHLLNALPVQVDSFYRTGASATAISVAAFAVAVTALAWLVGRATGAVPAALAAAVVLAANPNLLYLQATPMTESLGAGFMLLGLGLTVRWTDRGFPRSTWAPGLALAAACLTRYEAWPFTATLLVLVGVVLVAHGQAWGAAWRSATRLAIVPALAVLAFSVLSRLTVGEWLVTGGFYVPDERTLGHLRVSAGAVTWGARQLTGTAIYVVSIVGLAATLVATAGRRLRPQVLLTCALLACGVLPFYAFVNGHPFRIRYMVPLVPAVAAFVGLGVGLVPRRLRAIAAALVAAVAFLETPPFSRQAPMVVEAQWDRPAREGRQEVTRCLERDFRQGDDLVLASMGSLAHYMQELAVVGFRVRDFVHEGNGPLWDEALQSPARHVRWILFEEYAEGGDVLTGLRRTRPSFAEGFTRACEGGGVALYRKR